MYGAGTRAGVGAAPHDPDPTPPCKDKSLVAAVGRFVLRGRLSFGVVAERHSRCAPVPAPLNPVAAAAAAGVSCRVFLSLVLADPTAAAETD